MSANRQLGLTLQDPEEAFELIAAQLHLGENRDFGSICDRSRPVKLVDCPFEGGISAGKNTYVYDAHTYHTKVPPQGIETLIEHYTRPGDVVLDPFCGSGMTGVAAGRLNRKALLADLSPAAVFIAFNLNTPIDHLRYLNAVKEVLRQCNDEQDRLYTTHCRTCKKEASVLYTVWSYGLICPHCEQEFSLWDVARDERPSVRESKILAEFPCPHCGEQIKKRGLRRTKQYPVSIGYKCCAVGNKEATATPDEYDLNLLRSLSEEPTTDWHPTDLFPDGVNTRQPMAAGFTSVDKVYTPRALKAMALLWKKSSQWPEIDLRHKLLFTLTSLYQRVTIFSEFRFWGGSGNTANYNVPAIMNEQNVFTTFERKARTISWYFREAGGAAKQLQFSTQSACSLHQLATESVDYIFTDPPFGANINYSEMNFLWESWLGIKTDNTEEAIVSKPQGKSYDDYTILLCRAFREMYRVLKPNAWLNVVFHNSSEKAWNSIQTSLADAGFQIEGTQTFDKEHGTFKMYVSDNAVGYDLVIHCRKGSALRERQERLAHADTIQDARSFILRALSSNPSGFRVSFLHVAREEEFDYRRLYADWLSHALPLRVVTLGFEAFRGLVDSCVAELKVKKR